MNGWGEGRGQKHDDVTLLQYGAVPQGGPTALCSNVCVVVLSSK